MTVEDITKLYVDEKKSAKEIAAIYNVEVKKIQWFIKKNNISKHNKCGHKINRDYQVKQVSKEDIIKYYIDENMFLKDAAVKLNISEPTLRKKVQEYGIVKPKELTREHVMEAYEKINITEEELRNLYLDQNYSSLDIAKMCGCTKRTILLKLKKYGITDEKSDDVRNESMVKKVNKTLTEKYGEDLSGIYKNNSQPNIMFENMLINNNIEYEREVPLNKYRYDFKVNSTFVEINPSSTHNSTWGILNNPPKDKNYHKDKSKEANDNNYSCIHVFDWDSKDKILNLLKPKTSIYARKCVVKEVSKDETNDFLNKYHLQNTCNCQSVRIGLYYNDMLVSVITFGKPRYNKKYEYELLRLCFHPDYNIIGGSEKMLAYFVKNYDPKTMISYCDDSKFNGKVYIKLGFTLFRKNDPSKHWYNMKTGQHITDNLLRQKGYDNLFDANYGKGTDNDDLMKQNGFVEIYDCGQSTYVWKKEEK